MTEAQEALLRLAVAVATKPRAVVFDIDSTLASGVRREQEIRSGNIRDWGKHHGEMFLDAPIMHTIRKLREHRQRGEKVVLLTLRAERWRAMTEAWLRSNGIHYDELVMRPDGEVAPSGHTIKERLYREQVEPHYDVREAYDDSESNVKMFESMGIRAHRVADPGYPPLEGLPMRDPMYPQGKQEDWGPNGMGYMRGGKRKIYVMPHVRVTENGTEHVDGYWREIGLSAAIDNLKLELTRVYVMPHTRITEHGAIQVDGYWRDIDFDPIQVYDYPDMSAAFEGMHETPHEVEPGKFVRERELAGYIADKFETPFEHSTKPRPGRTPTKVTVSLRDGTITPTIHVPENLKYGERAEYIRKTLRAVFGDGEILGYRIGGDPAGYRTYSPSHWEQMEDPAFPDGVMNTSFDNLT